MNQPDFPTAVFEAVKAYFQLDDLDKIEETRELTLAEKLEGGLAFTSLLVNGGTAVGHAVKAITPPVPPADPPRGVVIYYHGSRGFDLTSAEAQALINRLHTDH